MQIKIKIEKEVLIDDEDKDLVSGYDWFISGSKKAYTAARVSNKLVYMHRLIMGEPSEWVDHINGNTFDNRKENLRLVNPSQSRSNSRKAIFNNKLTTSKYKGVHKKSPNRNWSVSINRINIGTFKEEIHAAMAYDLWAKELFGEFAKLNFPP